MTMIHSAAGHRFGCEALPRPRQGTPRVHATSEHRPPRGNTSASTPGEFSRPSRSKAAAALTGLTVVVVDDNEGNLDYFAFALRTYGALVLTATNAIDALRLVQDHRPDVVLSDIAMTGHDGYWLVQEIRSIADERICHVPVVATTAYGREHSRERVLAAGFTTHLPKPVDPDVLLQAIAQAAGR